MSLRLPPEAPIDLLMECSDLTLEELEMARWNLASKLRREEAALHKEIIRLESEALRAHWFREHRKELLEFGRTQALQKTLAFIDSPSIEAPPLKAEPQRGIVNPDQLREVS
jgi:hypothetical protein